MICPRCGSLVPDRMLVCEPCTLARADKHFAQAVATGSAPLMVLQMFPRGTIDPVRWHIQRYGDRRRAFCGAFIKGHYLRPIPYSQLGEFKPLCSNCDETLRGLMAPAAMNGERWLSI